MSQATSSPSPAAETSSAQQRRISWIGAVIVLFLLVALVLFFVFKRAAPMRVDALVLAGLSDVSGTLDADKAEALFKDSFAATSGFELVPESKDPGEKEGTARLVLELAVEPRERDEREDAPGNAVQPESALFAVAQVTVARRVDGITERYPSIGEGIAPSREQVPAAVKTAIDSALKLAAAHGRALEKTNGALESDARSSDPAVKQAAVTILAERGAPVAADFLLEQLRADDLTTVRRAAGGLVRLREPRAVSLLIERSRGHGLLFQREMLFAVAEIGGQEAEAYLSTVAEGHADEALRMSAREALTQLRRKVPAETQAPGETR